MINGKRFLFSHKSRLCKIPAVAARAVSVMLCLLLTFALIPTASAEEAANTLDINAQSAVLMDAGSGDVLYTLNPHDHLQIASVTKVMTLLIIMEALHTQRITLDEIVTASEYACSMGGSQIYLEPGEQMSVSDMIKAIAVASANDASVAMAEHIMGSAPAFVNAMNTRAKALGMKNTNFVNCNGLDAENQYSCAYDVALMSRELLKHDAIKSYLTIWMDTLRNGEFGLANTNKLVRFYQGTIGIKTGSTDDAKYCLSAAAERNGLTLIAVVLAAPSSSDRFEGAKKLLDYGFANYSVVSGAEKGTSYGTIRVSKGEEKEVEAVVGESFNKLIPKDKKGSLEIKPKLPESVSAPLKAGDKVGELEIFVDGKKIGSTNLVAKTAVPRIRLWNMFISIIRMWSMV
ncbi:MAG: D-alanyl-D-alanine carboxypeptidase DacF precursor [Firmicutes bacterium ADurb.Bin193]|nr:MAG: D-alanyl-D-alanine carboxypeptidase DacF precursor [Firmicutes bacterium ADurb.Bin193]